MTQQDIIDAFHARLALFPGLPDVAWEGGAAYEPIVGTPFFSPKLSSYQRRNIGAGVLGAYDINGTWTVVVKRSADEGRQPAGQQAAQLVSFFDRGQPMIAGGTPLVLLDASEQPASYFGGWVAIPVVVTFTATV